MVDLAGAFAKLDRADEHFETLQGAIQWWTKQNADPLVGHSNADMTEHSFIAQFAYPADFVRWGLLFGDTVHNLRSALDHVIWSASLVNGAPPERAEFPVTKEPDVFFAPVRHRGGGQYKISGITDPAVRALVERYQPWKNPGAPENECVRVVHDFDRIDKHRLIIPTVLRPADLKAHVLIEYESESAAANALPPLWDVPEGPIEENTRVFTLYTPTPPVKVEMKGDWQFLLVIELDGQFGGPLGTLGNLREHIRGVVEEFANAVA